jgi:hypothetical protein
MARALPSIVWGLMYADAAKWFFGSGTVIGRGNYLGYHRNFDSGLAAFKDCALSWP